MSGATGAPGAVHRLLVMFYSLLVAGDVHHEPLHRGEGRASTSIHVALAALPFAWVGTSAYRGGLGGALDWE